MDYSFLLADPIPLLCLIVVVVYFLAFTLFLRVLIIPLKLVCI